MRKRFIGLLTLLLLAACSTVSSPERLDELATASTPSYVVGSSNSRAVEALFNNKTGTSEELSWQHSGNQWDATQYPMSVEMDFNRYFVASSFHYYVGDMPFAATARLNIYARVRDSDAWTLIGAAHPIDDNPKKNWDHWVEVEVAKLSIESDRSLRVPYRFIKLEFKSREAFFNISEAYFYSDTRPPGGCNCDREESGSGQKIVP